MDTEDIVLGEVICPCRPDNPVKIPYRNADLATGLVFCPSCSRGVPVGQSLQRTADLSQAPLEVAPPRPPSRIVMWFRSLPGQIMVACMLAAAIGGAWWTWRDSPAVSAVLVTFGLERPAVDDSTSVIPKEDDRPRLTRQNRERLAFLLASGPAGPLHVLPVVHPEAFKPPVQKASVDFTVADIEKLPKESDSRSALITAQVWQQMLYDHEIPGNDPRYAALQRVIQELQQRLVPQPPDDKARKAIARFRDLMSQLRDAIGSANIDKGREIIQESDRLFDAHPRELAPYTQSYAALRRRFDEMRREREGIKEIEDLLAQAAKLARQGKGTEALECESRAKFLACKTPATATKGIADALEKKVRDLDPELRFARGQQAVADLRRCLTGGDSQTRDLLAQEARAFLSDLPSSKVKALCEEVEKSARMPIAQGSGSQLGQEVAFRRLYEQALEKFAVDDAAKTIELALQAQPLLAKLPAADRTGQKLEQLVFDVIEPAITSAIALPDQSADLGHQLMEARKLLDQASPWKANPRWIRLDTALRQRGEQSGRNALARAEELARKDRLEDACKAVEPAEVLGGPELARTARELKELWQQELRLRADQAAQDKHWQQIAQLRQEKKTLEAWSEVKRFMQRWPHARTKEVEAANSQLQREADSEYDAKFAELDRLRREEKWSEFRRGYEILRSLPLPAKHQAKFEQYRQDIERIRLEADGRFFQLAQENRHMVNQDQVVKLLRELPKILEMNPDHAQARTLLETARRNGRMRAEKLLESISGLMKRNRTLAEARIKEIEQLDPSGEIADKARQLLPAG